MLVTQTFDIWAVPTESGFRLIDRDDRLICDIRRLDDSLSYAGRVLLTRGMATLHDELIIRAENGEILARDSIGRACARWRIEGEQWTFRRRHRIDWMSPRSINKIKINKRSMR